MVRVCLEIDPPGHDNVARHKVDRIENDTIHTDCGREIPYEASLVLDIEMNTTYRLLCEDCCWD